MMEFVEKSTGTRILTRKWKSVKDGSEIVGCDGKVLEFLTRPFERDEIERGGWEREGGKQGGKYLFSLDLRLSPISRKLVNHFRNINIHEWRSEGIPKRLKIQTGRIEGGKEWVRMKNRGRETKKEICNEKIRSFVCCKTSRMFSQGVRSLGAEKMEVE